MDNKIWQNPEKLKSQNLLKTAWRYFVKQDYYSDLICAKGLLPNDNEGCCPDCPHHPGVLDDPSLSFLTASFCNDEDPYGTLTLYKGTVLTNAMGTMVGL